MWQNGLLHLYHQSYLQSCLAGCTKEFQPPNMLASVELNSNCLRTNEAFIISFLSSFINNYSCISCILSFILFFKKIKMSFCCSHFCHHSLSNIYKLYLKSSHSPLDTVFIFISYLHVSHFSYFQHFLISFRVFFHFSFPYSFHILSFFFFILAPFFSPASFQMLPVFKFSLYIQNNSHLNT